MIEISFGKLVLLALIALIVLGPEKLPHAARTAGALLRRVRSGWDSVRSEVERELQVEEIRRQAREAAARAEAAQAELDETLRKMRPTGGTTAADAPAPAAAPESAVTPAAEAAHAAQTTATVEVTSAKEAPHGDA
ncbi:MAG TPA: Sec-independent protein translocase protein TatB [Dyella sp.]|uniref:Sec-independent protein translocase protein TatB n=1 Tax=Dyella sp. TaxID=1869338 RepID=UPI002D77DB49|nr:Sec-independent protein translocase protein TatB [Dyella sp.]HET6552588.1 Sec-independent protein translocase protein TatB [Dyella sp.]